jgi:hypothetical protein
MRKNDEQNNPAQSNPDSTAKEKKPPEDTQNQPLDESKNDRQATHQNIRKT